MWLRVGCTLEMRFQVESPMLLLLRPRSDAHQWVAQDRYAVFPGMPIIEYTDMYGNLWQRLTAPPGYFKVEVRSDVQVPATLEQAPGAPFVLIQDLPDQALMYLTPSRYCDSDRLGRLAGEIVAGCIPGYDQVEAITRWTHEHLGYLTDSDPAPISALEAIERRNGVCRDFSHVGIALCRSLSIPARYVVGYLNQLEPMDLHAWFEAFVGGQWYSFDPTRARPDAGRVRLGYGRDAADVPVFNQFGPLVLPSRMEVSVEQITVPIGETPS
ncbi:cysteine protease [Ectothiorhodospira shaposhnikovii]|uniref:transglutaminase domain-containing protein n=1 Tax=Ectothiorhodospira shaposhnikovii TaxID=1054 RepID=UPI0019033C21|nr:transglutaminase family protein [Ectothiorhodospira shaposhnikovii]MBK1672450.1 cysteine protease [Ectothiorhodospira shaposhnikovii]